MDNKKIEKIRHSLAHLLAMAVIEKFPGVKLGIGPVIENGFYYDFALPAEALGEGGVKLSELEKKIKELIKKDLEFKKDSVTAKEAKEIFKGQPYKLELINELEEKGETITIYKSGDFIDLCAGPHVESSKEINPKAFKLTKSAGAYWKGSEKNPMLTRIYGLAFETEQELEDYLKMMAEAEKRDHRKLGKELKLFTFSALVGPGLPLFLPKGNVVKSELDKFMKEEKTKLGYSFVSIPHIAKTDLYKKSGHLGKYDAMMPIMTDQEGNQYVMKAMNCPHHFEIFNSEPHSYRDLPLRLAENTAVYRNEKSGELSGLTRVKSLTQDDTHHFVRHDQIETEIKMILGLVDKVYEIFGFKDFTVQISIRDPKHPENYFGDDELWEKSEKILVDMVEKWGKPYIVREGEAAFYGPKIDFMVKDSIGRAWQLTTLQLDFNQSENFHMRYVGEDGKEYAPAVLHVAILGSIERFMGILIEHYAGQFPVWLSPVQIKILNVGEAHLSYAKEILAMLVENGFRAEISSDDSIGKRIRGAKLQKVPYILVVGDKEVENKTVNVDHYKRGQEGEISTKDLLEKLKHEIRERK